MKNNGERKTVRILFGINQYVVTIMKFVIVKMIRHFEKGINLYLEKFQNVKYILDTLDYNNVNFNFSKFNQDV